MEYEVIFAATITLVVLVIIIIVFFVIFQTKKNKYILDKIAAEKKFEEEISKSQMEIQEQSLKNISWELHDNIGQLLSTAKMQLSILKPRLPEEHSTYISEVNNLIGDSLQEIRLLSRTLNPEVVTNLGLVKSLQIELERFNKLKFLKAQLIIEGEEVALPQKDQIILFRILQEFFSNAVKHSKATSLNLTLQYYTDKIEILAQDDGVGFDTHNVVNGSGLINMKSRAELIGASYAINAAVNEGVALSIKYNYKE